VYYHAFIKNTAVTVEYITYMETIRINVVLKLEMWNYDNVFDVKYEFIILIVC